MMSFLLSGCSGNDNNLSSLFFSFHIISVSFFELFSNVGIFEEWYLQAPIFAVN